MIKKILLSVAFFGIVGVCVFASGVLSDSQVGVPQQIESDSECPATRCANGNCHGFENIPEPDSITEMDCPEVSCSSAECHAWDTLVTRYYQPSDASLNLWILAPIVLIIGLVLLVKKV